MNRVNHSADSTARQVVPQDFSFLSDASLQVAQALEAMVRTMLGVSDNAPIFLRPLNISTRVVPGEGTKYKLGANILLYDGAVYELPEAPEAAASSINSYLGSLYIIPCTEGVEPSPVYGEGLSRDIYCHERLVMSYMRSAEVEFRVSDLKVIPRVMTVANVSGGGE